MQLFLYTGEYMEQMLWNRYDNACRRKKYLNISCARFRVLASHNPLIYLEKLRALFY